MSGLTVKSRSILGLMYVYVRPYLDVSQYAWSDVCSAVQPVLAIGSDGDEGVSDAASVLLAVDLHLHISRVDVLGDHGQPVVCANKES